MICDEDYLVVDWAGNPRCRTARLHSLPRYQAPEHRLVQVRSPRGEPPDQDRPISLSSGAYRCSGGPRIRLSQPKREEPCSRRVPLTARDMTSQHVGT